MNELGILSAIACCWFVFAAHRRKAALAFAIAALWIPRTQDLAIGSLHFTVLRIVILAGFFRVMARGERIAGKWTILDALIGLWGSWALCSSAFHSAGFSIARLGEVYTDLGLYYMFRVLLRDAEDVQSICRSVCLLLVPVAAFMIIEKLTGNNSYALLFGDSGEVARRMGHFRAKGPFAHPITAGTVGALSLPMALYLFRYKSRAVLAGLLASVAIIICSGASGPILTAASILFALTIWKVQRHTYLIRRIALLLLISMQFIMHDPVYYVIAQIDITGGSTSYYRAALIDSAIDHFSEWWLVGTDVTSHWASTKMGDQTDITNHYIQMGVWGGVPLLSIFVACLWAAFSCVGKMLRARDKLSRRERFLVWTLGSILFGHAVTFFSISYFDQANVVLFYCVLAVIATRYSRLMMERDLNHPKNSPFPIRTAMSVPGAVH